MVGGIGRLAEAIAADMQARLPEQRKTQGGKLSLLVATMLRERGANLMDLAASGGAGGQPLPADQAAAGQ